MFDPKSISDFVNSDVAKQTYDDVLSPVMKEVGKMGEDVVKTAHLIFAPLQFLAAQQDRLARIMKRLSEAVPDERRQEPPPEIVAPIMRELAFIPDQSEVSELFLELLAASMDTDRADDVHPAFVSIIRQLSPDEARIVKYLATGRDRTEVCTPIHDLPRDHEILTAIMSPPPAVASELAHPQALQRYLNHLIGMDLIASHTLLGLGQTAKLGEPINGAILSDWGWWFAKCVT